MKQRYHGEIIVTGDGRDRPELIVGTRQCVHCGLHFPVTPGSKRIRGWCTRCHGSVCGPACADCEPFEAMIERIERGG